MPNIFITGDRHGDYTDIILFCERFKTTKADTMIVLGDNGVNFFKGARDKYLKEKLQNLPITFIMLRGNHDIRPSDIDSYQEKLIINKSFSGMFYVDDKYPDLLFTSEGYYSFKVNNEYKTAYIINGAYSVDKYYRLASNGRWFPNEQLSQEEMTGVEKELLNHKVSYIFSHTCPLKYEPHEVFLSYVDQSKVDKTMETWLDKIEDGTKYNDWYCGHWHINKRIDKMHFLYDSIELLE